MATVLEVVTILERTPITKEALETTRLGRDINELRRKTKNESLAKRAKELVKRWRDLILVSEEGCATQQNGSGRKDRRPVVSPAMSAANSSGRSSPAISEAVPRTHANNKRLRKEEDISAVNGDCQLVSITKRDIVLEKFDSIARVAKVKTTQELVAGLGRGGAGAVVDSLAKTEHIARFLRSEPSDSVPIVDIDDDDDDIKPPVLTEPLRPEPSQSPPPPPPQDEKKGGRRTPAEEILTRLPPLDPDVIDWSEPPYSPPAPLDPEAVLSSNVDSVTGNESVVGFREWHEILSRPYTNGDVIHILPYVVID